MAIGQQVSIASKNYCYICVIFSNNIAITIFVCMIYMEPAWYGYQFQDGYHTNHTPLQTETYCFNKRFYIHYQLHSKTFCPIIVQLLIQKLHLHIL